MSHKKPKTRRKAYANPRGIFECNPRGYGFVKTSEGEYFIPASKTNGAFDGDMVEISRIPSKGSRGQGGHQRLRDGHRKKGKGQHSKDAHNREEARVVSVVERAHDTLIGKYEVAGPFGVVVPDDPRITHDIFTLRRESEDIEDGSYVRVRITEYPTKKTSATGVILEVLSAEDENSLIEERVIAKHDLETAFSDGALAEADAATLDIEQALVEGYRDIRDRYVFTIDPADAKDFDDALSLERVKVADLNTDLFFTKQSKDRWESIRRQMHSKSVAQSVFAVGDADGDEAGIEEVEDHLWRLGVHIADVSRYVSWGSSIDLDARRRATSVYLADRVIPMLPERLSNDLCSLRPGEDRLCFTVDIYMTDEAELVAYDLYPAVMRSDVRLTYDQALAILQGADAEASLKDRLVRASSIADARERIRLSWGGMEFKTSEAKVVLDESGNAIDIAVRQKNKATMLIEEAMVFANEVVATHLFERDWPCAYRDHEPPAADALSSLIPVLQEFGWFTKQDATGILRGNPHTIQDVLDKCDGRLEEEMITMLFLRAMMRAVYALQNLGHFGLGLKAYCHFTSPIRRYPDLIVHRMLKAQLLGRPELFDQEANSLRWLCEHSSKAERTAESASMDSQKAHMVEYMSQFVGQTFDALVSGVATYGLYVRLENCAEGLVPIRTLGNEYFVYDPVKYKLYGSDTGISYRLGQPVRVRLVEADTRTWRLDFELV